MFGLVDAEFPDFRDLQVGLRLQGIVDIVCFLQGNSVLVFDLRTVIGLGSMLLFSSVEFGLILMVLNFGVPVLVLF